MTRLRHNDTDRAEAEHEDAATTMRHDDVAGETLQPPCL